jgi:hypothetical protein
VAFVDSYYFGGAGSDWENCRVAAATSLWSQSKLDESVEIKKLFVIFPTVIYNSTTSSKRSRMHIPFYH